MDNLSFFLSVASSLVVLIILAYGAHSDVYTRKSPKWIWNAMFPIVGSTTLSWYIWNLYTNGLDSILTYLISSVIFSMFCLFMAYRRGNGGDWRALFYICLFTPWIASTTLLLTGVFGCAQVFVDWLRGSKLKSALMVSITLAFFTAFLGYVYIVMVI